MREAIQVFAPYVFKKPKKGEPDQLIGSYIVEGSKPGFSASAVWIAHRLMPLNITGYGKLIGETIDGALELYEAIENSPSFNIAKSQTRIKIYPLCKPDLNIVNYVFNFEGNKNLKKLNNLNKYIKMEILGFEPGKGKSMLDKKFIISSTTFNKEEYGNSILNFLKKLGIDEKEWNKVKEIEILRSVIMSPYLTSDYVEEEYCKKFINYLKEEIEKRSEEILKIYLEG